MNPGGPDEDGAVQVGRKLGFTLGMVVQERGWDETPTTISVSPSRTPSTPKCSTGTPTMSPMSSSCGGAMTTATWSTV